MLLGNLRIETLVSTSLFASLSHLILLPQVFEVDIIYPLYRWRNWDTKKLNELSKDKANKWKIQDKVTKWENHAEKLQPEHAIYIF